jgi:hypothetical protein
MSLISHELRQAVIDRASGICEYCHLPQDTQVATFPVDHVIPVSSGGRTEQDNLALACPRCNSSKWTFEFALDPDSGESLPLFHPRRDAWSDHFYWSEQDATLLEPRSPKARATISLLDLNSQHRRQVRSWLIALSLHPPVRPGN